MKEFRAARDTRLSTLVVRVLIRFHRRINFINSISGSDLPPCLSMIVCLSRLFGSKIKEHPPPKKKGRGAWIYTHVENDKPNKEGSHNSFGLKEKNCTFTCLGCVCMCVCVFKNLCGWCIFDGYKRGCQDPCFETYFYIIVVAAVLGSMKWQVFAGNTFVRIVSSGEAKKGLLHSWKIQL